MCAYVCVFVHVYVLVCACVLTVREVGRVFLIIEESSHSTCLLHVLLHASLLV